MLDMGESDSSAAAAAAGVKKSGPAVAPKPVAAAAPVSSTFMSYAFANVTLSLHKGTIHDFEVRYLQSSV